MTDCEMRLRPHEFFRIVSGKKTVEIRLFDEKRQTLRVGDTLCFRNSARPEEMVFATVTELLRHDSFGDLIRSLPMELFGRADEDPDEYIQRTCQIYSLELEKKYGVLGIRISLLDRKEK